MEIKSIRPPAAGVEAIQGVERSTPVSPLGHDQQARPQSEPQPAMDQRQALARAVEELNAYVRSNQRDLEFSIDDSSGQTVIKVVDPQTGDVVRQIPSELALNLAQALRGGAELQVGLIVSEQA